MENQGSGNLRGKETGKQVSDDTTNTVLSEHVETLIDADEELDLRSKIASDTTDNAEDESRPGRDVAGSGSDGDETSNDTRAETNRAPLLLKTVIEQNPGQSTGAGRDVGDNASHDSTVVGGESATTVEAEPTNPEENSSEHDVGDVVGTVRKTGVLAVTSALSEHEGVREGGSTRADMDRGATSEVETAHEQGPTIGVPGPVGNRIVDNRCPDEDENIGGKHAAAVGGSANSEGRARRAC